MPGARLAVRRAAKQLAANGLHRTGARRGLAGMSRRSAGGRRVVVVGYHRVVPDFAELRRRVIPSLLTSTETFERQLDVLERSFRIVPLEHALAALAGKSGSERDLCVVTFDDGYADFAEHALPALRRRGIPATLYVATAHVGSAAPLLHDRLYRLLSSVERAGTPPSSVEASVETRAALAEAVERGPARGVERLLERWSRATCLRVAAALEEALGEDPAAALEDSPLLGWEDLRALRSAGVAIGAHTVDHACLPNETGEEQIRQLCSSRERLEQELGGPVADFAYPNGWYSPRAVRALQDAGYRSGMTTEDRLNRRGENPLLLKRKILWEFTSRGLRGFSPAVAACNVDGVFGALRLSAAISGARPDRPPREPREPAAT